MCEKQECEFNSRSGHSKTKRLFNSGGFKLERTLTEEEKKIIAILIKIAPNKGILPDFGFYIKNGKIIINSSDLESVMRNIELVKRVIIIPSRGNIAELKL